MPVGGPGVGQFRAGQQVAINRTGRRPQTEGTIDVHPGAVAMRDFAGRLKRIEQPRVQLAGLQQHDGWCARRGRECRFERDAIDPAIVVIRHILDGVGAEADETHRAQHRLVPVLCCQHAQSGRAREALLLDIPLPLAQQLVAGGSKRRRMRHLRAGDERERCRRRDAEQIFEPRPADIFDDRFSGRGDIRRRILIPGGRQPIGGQRHRQRPADHPTEKARIGGAKNTGFGMTDKVVDNVLRGGWRLRQRAAELGAQFSNGCGGGDRAPVKRFDVASGVGCSDSYQTRRVRHNRNLWRAGRRHYHDLPFNASVLAEANAARPSRMPFALHGHDLLQRAVLTLGGFRIGIRAAAAGAEVNLELYNLVDIARLCPGAAPIRPRRIGFDDLRIGAADIVEMIITGPFVVAVQLRPERLAVVGAA